MQIKDNVFTIKHGMFLYIMVFFSSLVVFQFSGLTWFLYLQILFCVVVAVSRKKIILLPDPLINLIFLELVMSAFSGITSSMSESYKKAAVVMALFMIPMYFAVSYCYLIIRRNDKALIIIVKAFKVACMLQLLWIPFQYIMYHVAGIDVNKIIFVDTLHLLENASFIRSWEYYPSGFTWHSAVLAPLFVIAFLLFKGLPIRGLIIIDSIICGNSTSTAGMTICVILWAGFTLVDRYKNRSIKLKARSIIIVSLFIVCLIFLFYKYALAQILSDRVLYLLVRLFGNEVDASTNAHLQYFSDYFIVAKQSSVFQIFFGYGEGCSGYHISQLYNRYTTLGNWSIECDIVNILINRGVIGFVMYYYFLFYIAIKGLKIDNRYFITMISIIIQGFGYNVQWDYVLFIELIMYFTLKMNLNFFDADSKNERNNTKFIVGY